MHAHIIYKKPEDIIKGSKKNVYQTEIVRGKKLYSMSNHVILMIK